MMYSMDSSSSQHPNLPPGFRFHPTDEELVVHYLKRKADSAPLPVAIIADVDLYKFDPWELPSKAAFGEREWYFFSPRDRKYPNGARPNRAATSGYWKATGTDKPIIASDGNHKVGVKKALVFYGGKPPKGVKTNWIMHEYRLPENSLNSSSLAAAPAHGRKKNSLRLDDWVLCRIYIKNNSTSFPRLPLMEQDKEVSDSMLPTMSMAKDENCKPTSSSKSASYGPMGLENDHDNFFLGILAAEQSMQNGSNSDSHQVISSDTKGNNFPVKRALPSQFWNETVSSSPGRRFHCDLNNTGSSCTADEENNSFASLFSQFPQSSAFLGPVGDGGFRQQFQLPNINWNV